MNQPPFGSPTHTPEAASFARGRFWRFLPFRLSLLGRHPYLLRGVLGGTNDLETNHIVNFSHFDILLAFRDSIASHVEWLMAAR